MGVKKIKRTKRGNTRYDTNPFRNINSDGVDVFILKKLNELSKTAYRVYMLIIDKCVIDGDVVILNVSDLISKSNFKQEKSIYNGISELILNNIIACAIEWDEFYYNPKFINKKQKE